MDEPEAAINFLSGFLTEDLQNNKHFHVYSNKFFDIWLGVASEDSAVYIKYALSLIRRGEYDAARQQEETALNIALRSRDGINVAHARFVLGEVLRLKTIFQEALQQYDLSLRTLESYNQEYDTAVVRLAIGVVYNALGQYKQAQQILIEAYNIFSKFFDEHNTAIAYSHIGDIYYALGDLRQSLQIQQQVLQTAQNLTRRLDIGVANLAIGRIYRTCGDYQSAIKAFKTSQSIFIYIDDFYNLSMSQMAQGSVYMAQAKYDAAQAIYEKALASFENLGATANTAAINGEIGKIKVFTGDEQNGLAMIEQSNTILKSLNTLGTLAEGCLDYASALLFISRFEQAYEYLQMNWHNIEDHGYASVRNNAYVIRAKIKLALGNVQGAVEDAQVAANFYREQEVHTLLAQEAEELVKLGEKSTV